MFDSVRARLTMWYTAVLALVLIIFAVSAYFFLSRTLERRTDDSLAEMARAFVETISTEQQEMQLNATRTVAPDAQGQIQPVNVDAAVIEAASEYRLRDYQFVIYDESRRIIATSSALNVQTGSFVTFCSTLSAEGNKRACLDIFSLLIRINRPTGRALGKARGHAPLRYAFGRRRRTTCSCANTAKFRSLLHARRDTPAR